MGVHGKTVVGKTSTLNPLPINNKKKIQSAEININLKTSSRKSSISSTTAGIRPNASASVDANMAPALTEPLSPTEKLSSSAEASVSPTAATVSTESEEVKLETLTVTPSTSSSRSSPTSNTNIREKRNITRSVTSSTRITRSKETTAPERANTPSSVRESPTTGTTTAVGNRKSKRNSKEIDNEQMGISAATPSSKTTITTTTTTTTSTLERKDFTTTDDDKSSSSNNNNNDIVCKDNSTAQLLADLTTDFKETITAEICLRNQLPEVKVTTPDAAQLSASSETESETAASKSASGETSNLIEIANLAKHMDTAVENSIGSDSCKTDNIETILTTAEHKKLEKETDRQKNGKTTSKDSADIVGTNLPAALCNVNTGSLELPPVNSDSTMTASEEEPEELDALEAKLSQLDGSAVDTTVVDDIENVANATLTPMITLTTTTVENATQPRTPTPTQQQTATTPTQQFLLTPTSSTSQMLALTPQSTSSLMREITASVTSVGGGVGGVGGELEDGELEEVLKALKGFDANSAGAEGVLCDLNVLLNEVYTTLNCDEIATHTGNSGGGGGNVIGQQHQPNIQVSSTTSTIAITKNTISPIKDLHTDIEKKQQVMQRKIDFILRRLRKLQVRYMSKHTTEEIAGLFELTARLTNKGGTNNVGASKDLISASVISARPPPRSWDEDLKNTISPTDMVNLLSRLEKSANAQQICTKITSNSSLSPTYSTPTISAAQQMRKSKKLSELTSSSTSTSTLTAGAGAVSSSSSCTTIQAMDVDGNKNDETVVRIFNPQVVDELTHVTGMLRAEMRDIQLAYDSDATESSSGGESADEMVAYNNQVQQSLSIVKRAAWRYSRERAAIASRWSWLLSQIADLEIKIRQHSELLQEVVRTKGAVICEEELAKAANAKKPPLINAYGENEETILSGACRTRGYVPTQFRKRKMLQTTNLHTISKKTARPSTIKCGCQCPLNPCALCTGRADPTAPRDIPDTMMFPERVALLDPGFHPVLSFPENVSNSIHFEAISKTSNWQNRIMRIQPKSVVRSVWKAEREAAASISSHHSSRKYGDILIPTQKRRYIRRKDKNVTATTNTLQQQQTLITGVNNGNFETATNSNATPTATEFAMPTSIGTVTAATSTVHQSQIQTAATEGNGTATLFTSTAPTTTPLVANKMTSNMKMNCLQVGEGQLLEPHSTNISSNSNQMNDCQTTQNYDQYNPNQTPSSLISNSRQQQHSNSNNNKRRHYKQRKLVVSLNQQFNNSNNYTNSNNSNSNYTQQSQQNYNTQQNYSNGDINIEYWDTIGGGRSRTASPTHIIGGSSSNYHKYERSLERRNRISYDIDNIVIPYSVAAATRVEILPYKEIPTPKWRVFEDELTFDSDQEDTNSTTSAVPKEECLNVAQNSKMDEKQNDDITFVNENAINNNIKKKKDADEETFAKPIHAVKYRGNEKHFNKVETKTLITSTKSQICDKLNENSTGIITSNSTDEPSPMKKVKVEILKINEISSNTIKTTAAEVIKIKAAHFLNCIESSCKDQSEINSATDLEEDISDETLYLRHERALHEERRKFQTYLKFPWSTRSRANRRIDSRAESSGANTPDPASPAPNTPSLGGGDQESIPSPLAPSTPLTLLDAVNESIDTNSATVSTAHSSAIIAPPAFPVNVAAILNNYNSNGNSKRNERRRTNSTKTQYTERSERRSLTPDSREVPFFAIPPFEPLKFPLSDEQYEMLSSVTLLPPSSVSSFYNDVDLKQQQEDNHQSSTGNVNFGGSLVLNNTICGQFKTVVTSRNGRRSTLSTSKATAGSSSYDVNNKRRRPYRRQQNIMDAEHKVADSNDELTSSLIPLTNGQLNAHATIANTNNNPTANSTDVDEELEDVDDDDVDEDGNVFYDDLDDDDDDGYPKHPLAPGMDIDNLIDDDYDPYTGVSVGGNSKNHLTLSDSEFSEPDPFEDDDPNDPEWKGESSKSERHSERLRKRS